MTQNEYLEILFGDLGFNRQQRNAYLSDRLRRPVRDLDALSPAERSRFIDGLKVMKEEHASRLRDDRDEDWQAQ